MRGRASLFPVLGFFVVWMISSARAAGGPVVLPPGPAKATIESNCKQCHDLKKIVTQHQNAGWWANTLDRMVDRGLEIQPEDQARVLKYLSKNFGPKSGSKKAAH